MFLTYLLDIWENLLSILRTMSLVDYLDIAIIAWVIYKVIKMVKETRAEQLLKGILLVVLILIVIRQLPDEFNFRALGFLSDMFFNVGFVALIVMFQPELRRALEKMGRTKVVQSLAFNLENNPSELEAQVNLAVEQISLACEKLSRTATGALIVVEKQTKLGEQVDTGTVLNAVPSEALFGNIFFPNSPLHDGAVIIRNGLVLAAGCFLPKPQKEDTISKDLGSRHRAAIGMSEVSDAVVIVVSEETGMISIAENGVLKRGLDRKTLEEYLQKELLPEKKSELALTLKREKKKRKNKREAEINHESDT